MIVDSAIYVDGRRSDIPVSIEDTYAACKAVEGVAWIGLYRPDNDEFRRVAEEFDLHELAVEDENSRDPLYAELYELQARSYR